jgi:hypothetical protein
LLLYPKQSRSRALGAALPHDGRLDTAHAMEFKPRLDILPPPQRRLWDELAGIPPDFVLYGGTAVALHLGHRQSIDFDFFSNRALDATQPDLGIEVLKGATITQREPNTLSCTIDRLGTVQLSFFGLPRLAPPLIAPDNGMRVAALLDMAGTKASVVQLRAEAKDYIDIDAILTDGRVDLETALGAARALYGPMFNPQVTLKSLTYFEDGTVRRLAQAVRDRLVAAVRWVDLDRLPVFQPIGRGPGASEVGSP